MVNNVTLHYPKGQKHIFESLLEHSCLFILDYRLNRHSSLYEFATGYPPDKGYLIISEISEDKKNIWVEYVNYPPPKGGGLHERQDKK